MKRINYSFFKKIVLKDVVIESQDKDTLLYAAQITAKIDSLKYKKKRISIDHLLFENVRLKLEKDSFGNNNYIFLFDSLRSENSKPFDWQINCNKFAFNQSNIEYNNLYAKTASEYFMKDIYFDISEFDQNKDSIKFHINELNFNDGKQLFLNNLSTNVLVSKDAITFNDLNLDSKRSSFQNTELVIFLPEQFLSFSDLDIDFRFKNSKLSLYEIAELAPGLKGMNQVVSCSGHIYGNLDDLKGKNLQITTGKNTRAIFDFYANGLNNIETLFLSVDLKHSQTTFTDLSEIRLPLNSPASYLNFPSQLYDAGIITYKGNFTGFLSDFVAFGTFSSDMGLLTTDVSVIPDESGSVIYRGMVSTTDFELGELMQNTIFGQLTFDGNVDGIYNRSSQLIKGTFNGKISSFYINDYQYKNIRLDGQLNNKMFDGLLTINDPNLAFGFLGRMDFNAEIPVFNFNVELQKANPGKLNLGKNYPNSEMAFNMRANFTGSNLDNLQGIIDLEKGFYKNKNGELNLNNVEIESVVSDTVKKITLTSDFLDFEMTGNYHFKTLKDAFIKSLSQYLPALENEEPEIDSLNIFEYQVNAKTLDAFTRVFAPEFSIETPFLLYGNLNSESSYFNLEGSIPGFGNQNFHVTNVFIGNKPKESEYSSRFRFGEIVLKNDMRLYNLVVDTRLYDNILDNQISWNNYHNLTYSGVVKTKAFFSKKDSTGKTLINIQGLPSTVYIADTLWQISPFVAQIDSTAIEISDFQFFNNSQKIAVNGKITENRSDSLLVDFDQIKLGDLSIYLNKNLDIKGLLNGKAGIYDFYNDRLFFSDLKIEDFGYKNQKVGNIALTNFWDKNTALLNSNLMIDNNNSNSLYAKGSFNPANNTFDYYLSSNNLSLILLETVLRKNFSNFQGNGSGKVRIHGNTEKILLNGAVFASNAGLTIDYTQVSYRLNDSIYFKGDTIHFDNISIKDVNNNTAIFDGTIVHRNFNNMKYDMAIETPRIMAINTTSGNNAQFFGKVIASGSLNITGSGRKVNLSGSATTLPGTSVNISLDYEGDIKQYDFIEFVSNKEQETREYIFNKKNADDFTLNLNIHATSDARAQLIYNSQIGDVIKAQGEGILLFEMDKNGAITLSGNYVVEKGDYLFTLQNVINKRFSIEQGGSLVWSGNPYDAIIDLTAVYKLKASLYDLLNKYDNVYQNQRIPVECKIVLSEALSNPDIGFDFEFPTIEDRFIDEIQQYFNTDEEKTKQILSLLVMGKFYTPEYMRGTYEAQNPNLIGTTASELFSNQLSNWLSQIYSNVDIGVNYRPGNQISNDQSYVSTKDEIELALSTQLFNDRVTINGNVGNNVNPYSSNKSQLVGDFDINVKLNPSGKIQLKAYNRSNNNLIYETAPYTQGVGLSFKEEYNTFKELLQKISSIFRKKKSN